MFIALHDELVRSTDEINLVRMIELRYNITAKQVACPARTQAPSIDIFRVRPQQVTHAYIIIKK